MILLSEFRKGQAPWLVLVVLTASALAQDVQPEDRLSTLKSLCLEDLSKIDVTSVYKESNPAFCTPAAISVLTQNDIRRSGAVGVRGFQGRLSKSVLVLIDGRSVYTPLFGGVYWEIQDTLGSAMETHGALVSATGGNVEQGS